MSLICKRCQQKMLKISESVGRVLHWCQLCGTLHQTLRKVGTLEITEEWSIPIRQRS
jgi:hypothetical protein